MVKKHLIVSALAFLASGISANPSIQPGHVTEPVLVLPTCNDTASGIINLHQVVAQHIGSARHMERQIPIQQASLDRSRHMLNKACINAKTAQITSEQTVVHRFEAFERQAHGFVENYLPEYCPVHEAGGRVELGDNKPAREEAFGEVYNRHEDLLSAKREVQRVVLLEYAACSSGDDGSSVSTAAGVTKTTSGGSSDVKQTGDASTVAAPWEHDEQ
ncbi:hypothetical protein LTR85_006423 [Meristemomyces frigidus]|nr:hypothetical protein LTR85_006423 [Meristemomyces frigidus]